MCKGQAMESLKKSLWNHSRPTHIAFQFYEMMSEADYNGEEITEVASVPKDIVS
jgi:hypothetical protein